MTSVSFLLLRPAPEHLNCAHKSITSLIGRINGVLGLRGATHFSSFHPRRPTWSSLSDGAFSESLHPLSYSAIYLAFSCHYFIGATIFAVFCHSNKWHLTIEKI